MEECAVFLITLLCTEEGRMWGRLKFLSDEKPYDFGDLTEAVLRIEDSLDRQMIPRPSSPLRSFKQPEGTRRLKPLRLPEKYDKNAQFCIRIYYRQNSSWQGEIRWQNGEQKMYFRSVLELLKLMDSAAATLQI